MAYKKRAGAKRTFKPRQAKVPKAVKSYVNKKIRKESELKSSQIALPELAQSGNSFNSIDLLVIGEGAGQEERIGQEIKLQGLQVKGVLTNNTATQVFVRTLVLYSLNDALLTAASPIFKAPDGTAITATSIGLATASMNLMFNPLHKGTVGTVLHDSVSKLSPNTATDGTFSKMYRRFIKLNNRKMTFAKSGAVISVPNQRLQIIHLYSDAIQDGTVITVENSFFHTLWYRDI